jgi:hypothetical protein
MRATALYPALMNSASCKLSSLKELSGAHEARLIGNIILLNFTYSAEIVIVEYTKAL